MFPPLTQRSVTEKAKHTEEQLKCNYIIWTERNQNKNIVSQTNCSW